MGTGKKKIEIKQIIKEGSRMVTFSKRRKGLFKKASQLESMTNARVAIVVFSPTGKPYTCGNVIAAIGTHFPQFHKNEIESCGTHISQLQKNEIGSSGSHFPKNETGESGTRFTQFRSSEIGSTGSHLKNGLCDWLEKIDVEECGNLDELLLLKEQLEGTRDKLAEHSESFEALFV
ncbi:agamous-like MADS-box protein AGL61 [Lycium barbarum]|uniref:agamous-like MADS-box protein AGL61 n=1 Tax=Lycium barbarum TaxID=112863 RepID=UPI00293EE572|nr:agamous-like MADS-box protein AGL61 [Lycium barbarum]